MDFIPPEQYYQNLPKKRMAAGVLFFNEQGEVLLVKQNYKTGWSIPGGTIDEDESPLQGAIREVQEEIGLKVQNLRMVCVEYVQRDGIKTESLQFIFDGGTLSSADIKRIVLQEAELEAFKFVPIDEALRITNDGVRGRLPACFAAIREGKGCAYLER